MKTHKRRRRSLARKNPVHRRRRRFARRNPARRSSLRHVLVLPNGKRRRGSKRRGFARRNPVRRRMFARRNPADGVVGTIFDRDMMVRAGGVVIGTVGSNLLLNKLLLPNATTGAIPLALPGVNTSNANYMNSLAVAAYKFGIGALAGYALRKATPRLAEGIVIGAFAGAISGVLASSGALSSLSGGSAISAAGVSRYFAPPRSGTGAMPMRRGARSWTPGVNPIFTGPASRFLTRGSPMGLPGMRRGAGAILNRHTVRTATAGIPDPFKS